MAWTSSALSFLLPGLSKPVIVTGSQLPMFYKKEEFMLYYNTDAQRNVLGAIQFLAFGISEVCLYFADTLYRGNRVVKSNTSLFNAFDSPNFSPLGRMGPRAKLLDEYVLPHPPAERALENSIEATMEKLERVSINVENISIIHLLIFPAPPRVLLSMLQSLRAMEPPLRGIVFETYGEGNLPDFPQLQQLIREMVASGITIIDCTQVHSGDVNYSNYATGAWLPAAGVLSGHDMTASAAFSKLVWLLASDPEAPATHIAHEMGRTIAGEMGTHTKK
jgi:L-asparaginase